MCRLSRDKPVPTLKNYKTHSTTHHLHQNDGVVMYMRNEILVSHVSEIKLDQASCIQLDTYDTAILGIYRSPSNTSAEKFINSLNNHLETLKCYKNIIVTGDININLIPKETEQANDKNNRVIYLNMLSMHGLLPGHQLPTRGPSCLDHFMIKLEKEKLAAHIAILNTTITDHSLTFICLSAQNFIKRCEKEKTITNFNKALISLAEKNIHQLLFCHDPNLVIDVLIEKIRESLLENTHNVRVPKSKRTIKPWITNGMLRCIRNRNKLQKKVRQDPLNEILKISFKRYRNFCNKLLKNLKRNYERKKLEISTTNSKSLWKNIKSVTNMNQSKSENTQLLKIKNNPNTSVNYVNSFFANIGKHLAEDILSSSNPPDAPSSTEHAQVNTFVLLDTDPKEVHDILMSLKSDSAPGWDNIPTRFLKLAKNEIVPIIAHATNLCFQYGIFPKPLKQSIITPVFKSGDLTDVNNYRPISVLPSISKIIEKIINKRLINYLNTFEILADTQYGFRNNRSTEDAVTALTTYIADQVDRGNKCLAVYLDLKKAFDTVCVPTLLIKLENVGIRDTALSLLKEYLSNRTQKVKIGQLVSSELNITFGVPQGSVLGPTLFLVYINELCRLQLGNAKIISYADDTAIVFSNKTWSKVRSDAETGISTVAKWLKDNLLTLNAQKTFFMCYSIYNRTQPASDYTLHIHNFENPHKQECNCPAINKISYIKYLGVMIDQRLSWSQQIEAVSTRIRKLMWVFKILRHIASDTLLNRIYISLAQSILSYCLPIWGGAGKTKFMELERAQRALIKVIYSKPYRFPTIELYKISELLTVRKLYIVNIILKYHKTLVYNCDILEKRRKDKVAKTYVTRTTFGSNQYPKKSTHLYNLINKILDIYPKQLYECKKLLTCWIRDKSYDEIEALFQILV